MLIERNMTEKLREISVKAIGTMLVVWDGWVREYSNEFFELMVETCKSCKMENLKRQMKTKMNHFLA